MSDKDNKSHWKRPNDNIAKKDYISEDSINLKHISSHFENRRRSSSPSSSRSAKFSRSRSRSNSKTRKTGQRKRRSMSRSRSRSFHSHSPPKMNEARVPNQKPPSLDFMLYLSKSLESEISKSNLIKKIEDQVNEVKLQFDYDFRIPDLNGASLNIKSEDIKRKRDAAQSLLEYIAKNNLDVIDEEDRRPSDKLSILVMVPNGLVSMIIGTKGRQISKLMKDSQSNIVVNQPIYKMVHRTVSISGKPYQIANAIMMIYSIMEERFYEVSKIEMECRPLNIRTTQTQIKFVLSEESVNYLNSKKGSYLNSIKDNDGVSISFYQDKKNKSIERKEHVMCVKGTIEAVQKAILLIVKRIQDYIVNVYEGKDSYMLKMLINKVFVTKLIGANGCMIQEIANFSKGASIKILSNKRYEKETDSHDIIVSVAGSFGAIQDATCLIIEQIECFKKGGPVLKSGKSLHQNIAQQFINSIFCSAGRKDNEDETCYVLKDRFASKKRSRSRSRSRSTSNQRRKKGKYEEENNNTKAGKFKNKNFNKDNRKNSENNNFDYFKKDATSNVSYEEKGITKISNDIIVPDYLVSLLIGKNGECIRSIMNKSGSMYNDDSKVNTMEGVLGRVCNLKGTPQQNATAIQLISEMIIKLESSLNGTRTEN